MKHSFVISRSNCILLSFAFALLGAGCQAFQVKRNTVSMASNLSNVQYRQIIDNLALMADRPDSLPYFALTDQGRTLIQRTDQSSTSLTWALFTAAAPLFDNTLLSNVNPAFQINQQNLDEWDTTPSLDPVQELVMRGLYLKALGLGIPQAEQIAMESFFRPNPPPPFNSPAVLTTMDAIEWRFDEYKIPSGFIWSLANYKPAYAAALHEVYERIGCGWVHVGRLKDVPRGACYVAHHCSTYVWVMPNEMENLTNLTIAMLDVATTATAAIAGKTSKPASPKINAAPAIVPH